VRDDQKTISLTVSSLCTLFGYINRAKILKRSSRQRSPEFGVDLLVRREVLSAENDREFYEIHYILKATKCFDITYSFILKLKKKFDLDKKKKKHFRKTFFGGKRDFVKMCQVRCPKQRLKVPIPQLRRSLNCGTFNHPQNHIFVNNSRR